MHWIVDRVIAREVGYVDLLHALDRTNTKYTLVLKIPFCDYLVDQNNEKIVFDIKNPVYVTGTKGMVGVCQHMNFMPGCIDVPDYTEIEYHWKTNLLNYDSLIDSIGNIESLEENTEFFIRPYDDSKSFAGQTMSNVKFIEWRNNILSSDSSLGNLKPEDKVIISSLKKIYSEFRIFVIGGKIITGSSYRVGGKVFYSKDIDNRILNYVSDRIKEYCPRKALCIDIADTEQGLKIIELNSISSAGFYASDMNKFVGAINELQ